MMDAGIHGLCLHKHQGLDAVTGLAADKQAVPVRFVVLP